MKLATMQAAIANALGLDGEALPAFASRFRHLNQMSFPPMPAVGRGVSFSYRADEALAAALVFELGQAFVPPGVAVRIVVQAWPELVRGLSFIASGRAERPLLEIAPAGLADLGLGPNTSDQGVFDVAFSPRGEAAGMFNARSDGGDPVHRRLIVLDAEAFCEALTRGLSEVDAEAGRRFAGELEASLDAPQVGNGIRLSERDYFFQRAAELLGDGSLADAVAAERPLSAGGRLRDLIGYARDPLPRERHYRLEAVASVGAGFGVSLDALLGLVGQPNPQTGVAGEFAAVRTAGSLAVLHEWLVAHARTRAEALAVAAPSAANATRRRKAARGI